MGSRTQITYINAIKNCCSRYPDLYKLKEFLEEADIYPSRAAVLQFGSGRSSRVERFDFGDVNGLKTYLSRTPRSACRHRLYLLEDLSRDFIEAFGAHFWMDPFLFAAHENSTHWTALRHTYTLPRRLSPSKNCDPLFTLRYYEIVRVPKGKPRKVKPTTVSNVDRKIEVADYDFEKKEDSKYSYYIIRRNASFWSRAGANGGWDALILVDPPVGGDSIPGGKKYGYGYVDFTPWSINNRYLRWDDVGRGPPRTSTFDDIVWYCIRAADDGQVSNEQNGMAIGAIFLKKIVASNWNLMLEFVWAKLSEFERALRSLKLRESEGQQESLDQLAEIFTAVGLFRRRLLWYLNEVESSLWSVGIDIDKETDDEDKELLLVFRRLQGFKEKVESLTSVVTGMLSVRQADMSQRQADLSQKESKLVARLTFVALVFIPLSFTASIFSMGGDFLPGSSHFWVYFAAAVPMTFMVLSLALLLRGQRLIKVAEFIHRVSNGAGLHSRNEAYP